MRAPGDYQFDLKGLMRTFNIYLDTDHTNLSNEKDLEEYFTEKGYGSPIIQAHGFEPYCF